MARTAILAIKIISDARAAAKDFDTTGQKAQGMATRVQSAGRAAGKVLAVGLAGAAAAAVKFANAAGEDAAAASKLAQTLKRAAGASDTQVAATEKWITAQGKALGVADDELRPALSRLAAATKNVGDAQKLAALAMDAATAPGQSLASVSKALARAQNGNVSALGKLGISTKDAAGKTISFAEARKRLNATYGGAAKNAAGTEAGKAKILAVQYGELTESIGSALLPVMQKLTAAGLKVVEWIDKNRTTAGILVGIVAGLAAAMWVASAAISAYNLVTRIQEINTKRAAAGQAALNLAMLANPVVLIVAGVIALVAALVLAYKKSEAFRNIVNAVGKSAAAAFGWIVDKVKDVAEWVGTNAPKAFEAMKNVAVRVFDALTAPIKTVIGLVKDLIGFFDDKIPVALGVLKTVMETVGSALLAPFKALKDLIQGVIDKIKSIKLPDLPDLNPFSRAAVVGGGSVPVEPARNYHVTINGVVGDKDAVAREIWKTLQRIDRRGGGVF